MAGRKKGLRYGQDSETYQEVSGGDPLVDAPEVPSVGCGGGVLGGEEDDRYGVEDSTEDTAHTAESSQCRVCCFVVGGRVLHCEGRSRAALTGWW